MKNSNRIQYFTLTAIFIAIILLQNFVPWLGYIPAGATPLGIDITIIQITVALAAIVLGPKSGALVGLTWGLFSLFKAWTAAAGLLGTVMFRNPITAIFPRIMIGLIISILFNIWLRKKGNAARGFGLVILGALSAFINTSLVVLSVWIHFSVLSPKASDMLIPTGADKILPWIIGLVSVNGLVEMIASAIILPAIALIILPIVEKRKITGQL